jgi:hypothetical protein
VVSEQAKKSIEHVFMKAAKGSLALSSDDSVSIDPLPANRLGEITEKNIIVLTISSFLFRLLTIYHIDETAVTRGYFNKDGGERTFEDGFSEVGNMCCGAMNRDLQRYFPHLGMSTPYMLSDRCVPFLKDLNPGYMARYTITINGSVQLHATLCLCEYVPIDFTVDMSAEEEETGALEMF